MLNCDEKNLVLDERASKRFFEERHRVYLCAAIVALVVTIVVVVAVILAADANKVPEPIHDDEHSTGRHLPSLPSTI